tara:strand:- start:1226 stop:1867 length:642 start_codon:yes stop_codon:yes gene_type:complete
MKYFKKEAGLPAELYKILKPYGNRAAQTRSVEDAAALLPALRTKMREVGNLRALGYSEKEIGNELVRQMSIRGEGMGIPVAKQIDLIMKGIKKTDDSVPVAQVLSGMRGKANKNEIASLNQFFKALSTRKKTRGDVLDTMADFAGYVEPDINTVKVLTSPVGKRLADVPLKAIGDAGQEFLGSSKRVNEVHGFSNRMQSDPISTLKDVFGIIT